jgi:hypothetical protein
MYLLTVATALRLGKGTALVAQALGAACASQKIEDGLLDLSSAFLPLRDGSPCLEDPGVLVTAARESSAEVARACFPGYSHQADAAINSLNVTSDGWKSKLPGLLTSGCTDCSYLALLSRANSLMGDHRCVIEPRCIVVTLDNFTGDGALAAEGETACASPIYREMSRNTYRTRPRKILPPDLSSFHDSSL